MLDELYKILELNNNATEKDIRRAYARLVANHHPEEDPEGWKKIHDAYKSLLDISKKRRDYQKLAEAYENTEASVNGYKVIHITNESNVAETNKEDNSVPEDKEENISEPEASGNKEDEIQKPDGMADDENEILEPDTSVDMEEETPELETPVEMKNEIPESDTPVNMEDEISTIEVTEEIEDDEFDYDSELEELLEVIRYEKEQASNGSNAYDQSYNKLYDPNREMIKQLSEIVVTNGPVKKISTDKYRALRSRPQFIQAMLYPPFVSQLESYLKYINYDTALIKLIEEDINRVKKYIVDHNVPTKISYQYLINAMEATRLYRDIELTSSTSRKIRSSRKTTYEFDANSWWRLVVAGIILLFLIFRVISWMAEKSEENKKRDELISNMQEQIDKSVKTGWENYSMEHSGSNVIITINPNE